ncbi:MAG: DeoR/GlpR family DNA-binding transcription regulator [Oscillospiraceae bacterium]|nr:DeoR/GlpR family DNA-binding transcription regulator [Oscillospiraceae bacterium]
MISSARNVYILRRLNELGIVDYKSIASELGVSEATVRRDFEKLEGQGKLRRVQSGAMRPDGVDPGFDVELSIRAKNNLNTQEKLQVARAAAELVQPGECVFLDMGTSIAPLAPILLNKPIRIVTGSNVVLQRVTPECRAQVFVLGGRLAPADQMILGPMTESNLREFGFNRAFVGCMGLDVESGNAYATDMECVRLKQVAIQNAEHSYLLADQSKLNKVGLFRFTGLDAFEKVFLNGPRPEGSFPANIEFAP